MSELLKYAEGFVGAPYRWGGSGPHFDCSGFVQEVLTFVGIDPKGDQSAQALFDYFKANNISAITYHQPWTEEHSTLGEGALIFYGKDDKSITHIDLCLNDFQVIGAIGGGSGTVNVDAANFHGAFVKKRLFGYRKDVVACLLPNYPEWALR